MCLLYGTLRNRGDDRETPVIHVSDVSDVSDLFTVNSDFSGALISIPVNSIMSNGLISMIFEIRLCIDFSELQPQLTVTLISMISKPGSFSDVPAPRRTVAARSMPAAMPFRLGGLPSGGTRGCMSLAVELTDPQSRSDTLPLHETHSGCPVLDSE